MSCLKPQPQNKLTDELFYIGDNGTQPSSIRLYLSTASKQKLSDYLENTGKPGFSVDYVVLKSDADSTDCFEYLKNDILGHRAAFRLKGIAFGDGFISVRTLCFWVQSCWFAILITNLLIL